MAAYCPSCNTEISSRDHHCPYCGAKTLNHPDSKREWRKMNLQVFSAIFGVLLAIGLLLGDVMGTFQCMFGLIIIAFFGWALSD